MTRILDVTQPLKTFEGLIIPQSPDNADPTLLRHVLLTYLACADDLMAVKPEDHMALYELGPRLALHSQVELTQGQWDLLKRICDSGKVRLRLRDGQVSEEYRFPLLVRVQAKGMVDAAPLGGVPEVLAP